MSCLMFETGTDPYSKGTACVSVKEKLNDKAYEVVLNPCDKKLPSICQIKLGTNVLSKSYDVNLFKN